MNSVQDSKLKVKEVIYLRTYSKVIFFYPLLFISLIFWLFEFFNGKEIPWFGFLWAVLFFINLFVISFDVNSTKFFIFFLVGIIIIIIFIFLILSNIHFLNLVVFESNITMSTEFYLFMFFIFLIIIIFAIIAARFDYWKLERNEIYHKRGLVVTAERYPTKNLRIKKRIPDLFEFLLLKAGSITLIFQRTEVFNLNTVLNINKKSNQIDTLLSYIEVEVDELDNK